MYYRLIVFVVLLSLTILMLTPSTHAQSGISVTTNSASIKFPESATFSVDLKSNSVINQIVLEYGVEKVTCGTVVSKVFVQFTPATQVNAKWDWDMRKTGSEPPGATLWWRWRITDADGKELVTDRRTILWLDTERQWQSLDGEWVSVHWYSDSQRFVASAMYDAAVKALRSLAQNAGLKSDAIPHIYVFASTQDLRNAIYNQPSWVGGLAYGAYNIVVMGVSLNDIEWGRSTVAHELTHVLHRRLTFSCLSDTPNWLTEGLAGYGQGGRSPQSMQRLQAAIANDTLISLRTLSSSFPEDSVRVDLSYTESYSVVDVLIGEYGKDKFIALLRALQIGTTIDDALRAVYGFDTDGLEDVWRAKVHAKPRPVSGRLTPTATPTRVPTLAPLAGLQFPTRAPTSIQPTATATPTGTPVSQTILILPARHNQLAMNESLPFGALGGIGVVVVLPTLAIALGKRRQEKKP